MGSPVSFTNDRAIKAATGRFDAAAAMDRMKQVIEQKEIREAGGWRSRRASA
jgi:hypothetical protein